MTISKEAQEAGKLRGISMQETCQRAIDAATAAKDEEIRKLTSQLRQCEADLMAPADWRSKVPVLLKDWEAKDAEIGDRAQEATNLRNVIIAKDDEIKRLNKDVHQKKLVMEMVRTATARDYDKFHDRIKRLESALKGLIRSGSHYKSCPACESIRCCTCGWNDAKTFAREALNQTGGEPCPSAQSVEKSTQSDTVAVQSNAALATSDPLQEAAKRCERCGKQSSSLWLCSGHAELLLCPECANPPTKEAATGTYNGPPEALKEHWQQSLEQEGAQ